MWGTRVRPSFSLLADDIPQLFEEIGVVLFKKFDVFGKLVVDPTLHLPPNIAMSVLIALLTGQYLSVVFSQ